LDGISNEVNMTDSRLDKLIAFALNAGATDAAVIYPPDIVVEDQLADRCREPRCENFGLSKSCPPHVQGPAWFKENKSTFTHAIFFKIDVPSHILFSSGQKDIFQLLHETAAGIELEAKSMGFERASGFAGSSCKQIFCDNVPGCPVVEKTGNCRYPNQSRPSMSGFGINVAKLIETAGWTPDVMKPEPGKIQEKMTGVYGLVLID
jgi:predicted metal-binding protein